ncbi:MAG: GDSL-type esterase/lipase family protein [Gammaproteobacteria bacterium]|nr:GDSL-type esterase/lipase family protein [Gammaproteobacteria bacterium]
MKLIHVVARLLALKLIVLSAFIGTANSATYTGVWTLDESTGLIAGDSSGNQNDGTLVGSSGWTAGMRGTSLTFSGGADRVLITDEESLNFDDSMSISAWIRPNGIATQYVIKKGRNNVTDGYEIALSVSGAVFVRFNQMSSGNAYRVNSASNYPVDGSTWMHVAAVYDGLEIKLYINGVLENSQPASFIIANNNLDLSFGGQDNGLSPFNGALDEVYISDHALTASEVLFLYQEENSAPSIYISELQSAGIQASQDLIVQANMTGVESEWGIRFDINSTSFSQQNLDYSDPFEQAYLNLPPGDYTIQATIVDESGTDVVGMDVSDIVSPYGIGRTYIAVGDSITAGAQDDIALDDVSSDLRNSGGGFTPVLNNLLTQYRGYPNSILNMGVASTTSFDGISMVSNALQANPNASHVLLHFGANDRYQLASGLGQYGGDVGYAGSYKDNMQQIIDLVISAGKTPVLGKVAITYTGCSTCTPFADAELAPVNATIREFNLVVEELVADNLTALVGPDWYSLFKDNPQLISADGIHPNGVGYQRMAREWLKLLEPTVDVDGDGYLTDEDAFPSDPTEWADYDMDGIGNNGDLDDDNDGMPDSWEVQYGFNPLDAADAILDADGDGTTNLDEYLAGTIPRVLNLDSHWQFDESSGVLVSDGSTNGNDGNVSGTPVWSTGVSGSALFFGGGNDRVLIDDAPSLNMSTAMSLSVWIQPTTTSTQYVLKKGRYNSIDGYEISLSGSQGVAMIRFNQDSSGNTYRINATTPYPTDGVTWMHIATTYDGATMRLYINGIEEGSLAAPGLVIASNSLPFSIGAQDDGVKPFYGAIDAVHLYDYALSAAQLQALSTLGQAPDSDGDGVPDAQDLFPSDPTEWADYDMDGIGNNGDLDDDNDGMPDSWEVQYGFNPLDAADAILDADGDGTTNLDEYLAGTIPRVLNLDSHWQFDENSGVLVSDGSTNGNDGSVHGAPVWSAGVSGSALFFGGGSDRVLIDDAPSLNMSTAMSLSVWIQPTTKSTQYVLKKGRYSSIDGYEISLSGSRGVPMVRFNQDSSGNTYRINATTPYPTDGVTWMHIAATYDGATVRLYINGIEEGSLAAPGLVIASSSLPLSIGAQDDGIRPFYGVIDAVHLYDYAISDLEIESLSSIGPDGSFFGYQKQNISSLTITSDVADKPQSKVWQYNNDFWMIVPDATGTWVWRLDGLLWVKVLQVSTDLDTRVDVKLASSASGLVHALLHNGSDTTLVSLEPVPGVSTTYQLWSQRSSLVDLPPGSSTETITLEIDSNDTMWVARDFANTIEVLYSVSPYSDWSNSPITIDSNISADDISGIVRVGTQGIGVMWSNQNSQRFGFVYRDDVDGPTVWSATEFPGALNALNLGKGLADDHINLATRADGTVYAAVKTGYDDDTSVNLGLFVRSPAGTWGDIIPIDYTAGIATRPIILVNEVDNVLSYIYSNSSVGGSIVYTEASLNDLNFSPVRLLLDDTESTNTSSMKQNYSGQFVVLATPAISNQTEVSLKSVLVTK